MAESSADYAKQVAEELKAKGLRVNSDLRGEKIT
ncbi:MAG TPA: hypothetical protein GXX62_09770, partial [Alcaligenaceae bacterium]|nr:hypothetical protein [Alcaligenaceae bacterium]